MPSSTPTPLPTPSRTAEVNALRGEGETFLNRIVAEVEEKLREHHIKGRVESRIKRIYSIQQKLASQKIPVEQVYDLLAIRVICEDCRRLLRPARPAAQRLAPSSRPHQGLHRDAAA